MIGKGHLVVGSAKSVELRASRTSVNLSGGIDFPIRPIGREEPHPGEDLRELDLPRDGLSRRVLRAPDGPAGIP